MKIVITGAQGLLGQRLYAAFESHAHAVVGIDKDEADITRADEIIPLIMSVNPNMVIHTAAITDLEYCELNYKETYLVNALGTKNIALACQKIDAELLYISTDHVFSGGNDQPYLEWDTPQPLSIYGLSKKLGEDYIQHFLNRYYVVRTAGLFDSTGRNFVDAIFAKARKGEPLKVVGDEVCNRTYAPDLVEGIVRLVQTRLCGMYHIVNGGASSWYDFAVEIMKRAKVKEPFLIESVTAKEYGSKVPRPAYSALNTLAYETVTGHALRPCSEALDEYMSQHP